MNRKLFIIAAVLVAAGLAVGIALFLRGRGAGAGAEQASGGPGTPGPRRLGGEGEAAESRPVPFDPGTATPEQRRAVGPPADAGPPPDASIDTPPDLVALIDPGRRALEAAARACGKGQDRSRARWIRIRLDLVFERGQGRADNLRVVENELGAAGLERCVLDAIAKTRWPQPEPDQRVDADLVFEL